MPANSGVFACFGSVVVVDVVVDVVGGVVVVVEAGSAVAIADELGGSGSLTAASSEAAPLHATPIAPNNKPSLCRTASL